MKIPKSLPAGVIALFLLLVVQSYSQQIKPPYILGKNNERIKSKNFLAGKKPAYGKTYNLYNNPRGASIAFDKGTNEFEIVTGAENTAAGIRLAKQDARKAETILLRITGIAAANKCKLKVLVRILVPDSVSGGRGYEYLPSCGPF